MARFATAEWMVSPNLIFRDSADRAHELDVWAARISHATSAELGRLATTELVECKRSRDKPWVFFTQECKPFGEEYRASAVLLSDFTLVDGRPISRADEIIKLRHHYVDEAVSVARTYFEAFKEHRKDGDIFNAVTTLLHARAFARRWFDGVGGGMHRTLLLHPIIVFDGKLFAARRTEGGEWAATPTDHIQIRVIDCVGDTTTQPLIPSNEVAIDVVTSGFVEQLLALIRTDLEHLQHWISDLLRAGRLAVKAS